MNSPSENYRIFDADNHYYEAEDAFTRYIPKGMERRAMQWVEVGDKKKKLLMVGGKLNHFIPNPTFDPVARAGCMDEYYRGRNPDGKDMRALFGELEPIRPSYRDRDQRIKLMDEQGIESALLFPTLGVGMEEALIHDPQALSTAFEAFNRWLLDDWGFNYKDRVYAAPYLTLVNLDAALEQLEWVLREGARTIVLRPGPVRTPSRSLSPAAEHFDPFWARVNEAGILVAMHSGDSGYDRFFADWGESDEMTAFGVSKLRNLLSPTAIMDTMAAFVAQGLFDRHRNLRVATIEAGSEWVPVLFKKFRKSYGQMPHLYREDPIETFRRHIWVSPYYEDDLMSLCQELGDDNVIFGSDFPHAEGLENPISFRDELAEKGFDEQQRLRIMRENGMRLVQLAA